MKVHYRRLLTAVIAFSFICIVWNSVGIYWETNDDRYIGSILSGMLVGEPNPYAIHINYLLSYLLMMLYRITKDVPWYGGMLVLFQGLAYWGILDSAFEKCKRWYHMLIVIGMTAGVFGSFCYCVGQLQYTSTATMLAIAGYVCLILYEDKTQRFLIFFLFEFLAYLLRVESMLLMIPFCMVAVMGWVFCGCEGVLQEKVRHVCVVCGVLLTTILVATMGDALGYHGEAWKQYRRFNDARTAMFDYYGKPDSDEVKDILEEYKVSPAKYNAFLSHVILDWSNDVECAEALEDYSRENYEDDVTLMECLQNSWRYSIGNFTWDINKVLIVTWILYWAWVLCGKQWKMIIPGGAMLLVRTGVWSWMLWRGRMPLRVTIPLLACETILVLTLIWVNIMKTKKTILLKTILLVCCIMFVWTSVNSAKMQYQYLKKENGIQEIYIAGFKELLQYCNENKQNRYLIDSSAVSWYQGSVYETDIYQSANAIVSGGWFSNSPIMQLHLQEYLGSAKDGIYAILCADGGEATHPMVSYLKEEMKSEPVLTDVLTVSHGGKYAVYYVEGSFPFD